MNPQESSYIGELTVVVLLAASAVVGVGVAGVLRLARAWRRRRHHRAFVQEELAAKAVEHWIDPSRAVSERHLRSLVRIAELEEELGIVDPSRKLDRELLPSASLRLRWGPRVAAILGSRPQQERRKAR